jgi:AcrR family transcriptional regulator
MPPTKSTSYLRVVEAAAKLFAQKGYHGTSTREIAQMADVSENTLFRHFTCKEDLFWTAFRFCTASIPHWNVLTRMRTGESLQVVLPEIIEALTETANRRPEVLRLLAVAFVELRSKAEAQCKLLLSPLISEISEYLAMSVAKGEVLEVDPSLLVASLMAMTFMHPQFVRLTSGTRSATMDARDAAKAYSKFWLDLLAPRAPVSQISSMEGIA